jgi:hypothetical protein
VLHSLQHGPNERGLGLTRAQHSGIGNGVGGQAGAVHGVQAGDGLRGALQLAQRLIIEKRAIQAGLGRGVTYFLHYPPVTHSEHTTFSRQRNMPRPT